MKTFKSGLSLAVLSLLFFACGNAEIETKEVEKEAKAEVCSFEYNNSTTVNWTAFKLTEKVGVNGAFDSVVVENTKSAASIEEALTGATFSIYTVSSNSNDSLRDWKIANHFFGTMTETESITGSIKSLKDGTGEVELTMNGVSINVPTTYTINEGNEIFIKATVDVPTWNAQSALDELGEVCAEKHTGPDGKNVLWPDVEVKVFVGFTKECK